MVTSRRWLGVEEVKHLLSDRCCPNCGGSALENLQRREVVSPVEIESSSPPDSVLGESYSPRKEVVFESAAVLRGLTARLRGVDEFVGGLKPGWFVLLRGSGFADRLVERYCVKALLQSSRGRLGSGGSVFFVDAGMVFDPYSVASLARVWRFSAAEALDRVVVARAFTCYELWSLIADLPKIVDRYGVSLVVVSGIFSLFSSVDDVKQGEAEQILDFVRRRVTDVCRERKVLCIATAGGSGGHGRIRGSGGEERPFVSGRLLPDVDVLVEFRERNRRVYGSLLKHPSRSPVDFWVDEPENKSGRLTLDSFQLQFQQQEVATVG
ncbi:MAG: hypothetical protein HYY22_00470 [Thaumarchaeota archaeon]|nr:hypothetical protein [Nitrososphaerota archaeon]